MQMIIVKNNAARPLGYGATLPGKTPVVQTKMLTPGANEVPSEEFEKATKKSPVWAKWLADKVVEVVKAKPADAGKTLAELHVEQAKQLITETFDRELLGSWIDNETRADVKKALRKRDEFLEAEYKRREQVAE